ncbi:MAG: DNA cytosine methyltransferase [Rhizobiales bacterium]|nr:DNA cytosine methyltransferase [Hyphomicrobiales bacterium]
MDIGLEAAGFRIALAVERDPICCETLRTNHRWPILEEDLADATLKILPTAKLHRGDVDMISAGPPCQPFSKSANWSPNGLRRLRDPRAAPMHNLVEIIEVALPKCVLVENVEGFRRSGLRFLLEAFRRINRASGTRYLPRWRILNAADFGVPQQRRRFFLVAFRDGTTFEFPIATHENRHVTCWDAIGHLARKNRIDLAPKGRWANLLPSIPEGHNYLWHTNRGGGKRLFGWRTKYWSFLLKLAKCKPAWTIPAQPAQNAGPFHWRNRQLRTAEMLRLQTFPKHIFVAGTRADRQRQIGNAVPALLAEVIGRAILAELRGKAASRGPYKLAILTKRSLPKRERATSPKQEYLHMIGRHEDHPGPGLGPASR